MRDLITKLVEAGSVGLDLSPGDPLCREAAFEIGRLKVELDKINGDYGELLYKSTKTDADRIRALEAELADWQRMRNEAMAQANRDRIIELEAQLGRSGSDRIAMLAYAVEQLSAALRRARPYVLNHDCADAAELEALGLTMRAIDQALGSELETSAEPLCTYCVDGRCICGSEATGSIPKRQESKDE